MRNNTHTKTIIESFEAKALRRRSFTIRIADELTSFFGSFWFLVINIAGFSYWIMANTGRIEGVTVFDPFPFVLMTTIVSLEAIILTIVILISQGRQSQISKIREELDMQVNLIAEKEITKALKILVKIAEKQGIKIEKDEELTEMLAGIDTSYIESELEEQLNDKSGSILTKAAKPIFKAERKMERKIEKEIEEEIKGASSSI